MPDKVDMFSRSINTFFFGEKDFPEFAGHVDALGLRLSYTPNTHVEIRKGPYAEVVLIGECIDSHGEMGREDIAVHIATNIDGLDSLLEFNRRLCGKYVVLYRLGEAIYVLNDAITLLPVYYHSSDMGLSCSSLEYPIARLFGLERSSESREMDAAFKFRLPYLNDSTRFSEIKYLLANHYLDFLGKAAVRYYPLHREEPVSPEEAVTRTLPLIRNLIGAYQQAESKFLCTLSGGWDSRLVLAFLLSEGADVVCYTSNNSDAPPEYGDVWVPPVVARAAQVEHYTVGHDREAPQGIIEELERIIEYSEDAGFVDKAEKLFGGRLKVSGDIIDHIGKRIGWRKMPNWVLTATYFQYRDVNLSEHARKDAERWLDGLRGCREFADFIDLFHWEWSCKRVTNVSNLYALMGYRDINFFNCREIIELWSRVPANDRARRRIHDGYFKAMKPAFLDIPANPLVPGRHFENFMHRHHGLFTTLNYLRFIVARSRFGKKMRASRAR